MSIELKIKSKHLALEAGVIRFEEEKLKKQIRWFCDRHMPHNHIEYPLNRITNHRKWEVRNEQRATFLARAYIAGKPYLTVERSIKNPVLLECYIIPRVVAMAQRYHSRKTTTEDIKNWICSISPERGLTLPR